MTIFFTVAHNDPDVQERVRKAMVAEIKRQGLCAENVVYAKWNPNKCPIKNKRDGFFRNHVLVMDDSPHSWPRFEGTFYYLGETSPPPGSDTSAHIKLDTIPEVIAEMSKKDVAYMEIAEQLMQAM